jgi:hypothetical protein
LTVCSIVLALLLAGGSRSAWAATVTPSLYANASPATMVGFQVFDHVNLTGASATGTLSFKLYAPGDTGCSGGPVFSATIAVSGTGSDDSPKWWTTGAGTYQWTVAYSGDANNNPTATACGNTSQQVIVGPANPMQTTTAARAGSQLHATTSLTGGFAPLGGTITFNVTGPDDQFCGGAVVYTHTVAVSGAGSYDSGSFTPTVAGTYIFRIRYSGDTDNYGVGPSACRDQPASIAITQDQLACATATFRSPTDGGVKDTTQPFTWTAAVGADKYALLIGSSPGGSDLTAATVPSSTLSYEPALLPTGQTLYARLWTMTNGAWTGYRDMAFTASDGAVFSSPTDGQRNLAPSPFTWSAVARAQKYAIWLGTTRAGYDLGGFSVPAGTTSYDVGALPVGRQLYARVWTMVDGGWVRYQDVAFTAGQGAAFTSPTPGQTQVDPASAFTWTPASAAQNYVIWIGTSPGAYDVSTAAAPPSATSYAPTNLPSGRKLYARIWTEVAGAWPRYQDVAFTTAG